MPHAPTWKSIRANVLLGLAVVAMAGLTVVSVQWFSDSVAELFFTDGVSAQGALPSSLITGVENITSSQKELRSETIQPVVAVVKKSTTVDSKSAIAIHMPSGVVTFDKSSAVSLPIASLTKLMTSLVVLRHYDLDQKITISEDAMKQEGEQGELKAGQIFSVKDLLYSVLMESSNRAAYALSDVIGNENFVGLMNDEAKAIGLTKSFFADSSGLDKDSRSSAKDVAILSYYIFEQFPLFRDIIATKEYPIYMSDGTFHHKAVNINRLLGGTGIIGGKTGYTNIAQGCLMIIRQNINDGGYTIYVVLGAGDRVEEMQKLMNQK